MARSPSSWRGMPSFDGAGDGRPERVTWRPTSPLVPPRSIVEAVRAMQAGAVLSVVEVARALVFRGDLREAFVAQAAQEGRRLSADNLDLLVTVALTVSTIIGIVGAALWFVQSRLTAQGSRWGRIVACLLLAVGIGLFLGGAQATAGPLARGLAVVLLLLGAFAVVRLWHRDSSAWIRYHSRPDS